MAILSFKDRIIDLAGSLGTADDNALQQWLLDCCYDVINKLQVSGGTTAPDEFTIQSSSYNTSMTVQLDSIREVISVQRDGIQCKLIPFSKSKYANPSDTLGAQSIYKATSFDPVFYKHNNKLIVLPHPTITELGYYSYIPEYSITDWDGVAGNVSNFPKQYYEHIVLYAAIATLDRQLLDMVSNTDITTALTAATTAIGDALTEIDETIELTDSSGSTDIQIALTAINTAVDKFRADGSDPALFGDDSTYDTTNSEMTRVKDALDQAKLLIDGSVTTNNVIELLNDEDSEMVSSTLSAVQAEVSRAQAHISEWNATVQTLDAEIKGFSNEVQARIAWIGAKAQAWGGKLSLAQSYLGEVKALMERDNQTYQWQQERRNFLKQEYVNKFPNQRVQGGKE